jgi:DNA mismatch repair protein MSH2
MTLETRKDGTKFTSRALKDAAERLQSISKSYDQRQQALVEQACSLTSTLSLSFTTEH